MKKQILSEINRAREIMGLNKLIITEQAALLKFFLKSFAKTKDVWTSLNRTVLKKYGKTAGAVPISKVSKADDMIEVLSYVMEKTPTMVRNNGQSMKGKFFGAGIDMTEQQAGRLGKAWTESNDAFVITIKSMGGPVKISKISNVLIKSGTKASGLQKPMIEALGKTVGKNIKNTDDLANLLAEVGMNADKIKSIIRNIEEFGTVGTGKNLEEIFQAVIQSPNYQQAMIKSLKESPDFRRMWKKGMTQADLGNLIGRSADDPLTTTIFKDFSEPKWLFTNKTLPRPLKWVYNKGAKLKDVLWHTKFGRYLFYYVVGTLGMNYFLDQKWLVYGKKKAALTPDLYNSVEDNPNFLKKFGGYTDAEALAIAEKLNKAIEGNMFGPFDQNILTIYDEMPSILACSQVCYMWENKVEGTVGSLYKTLAEDMSINWFPRPFSDEVLGDITISDVKDIFTVLTWTTSTSSASKADFKKEMLDNWPHYHLTLDDGGDAWYSRLSGPIDGNVLGVLLQACEEESSQEDCLRNMDPFTFNSAYNKVRPEEMDVYTETQPTEVKDETEAFFENWLSNIENSDEEPPTTIDKLYIMVKDQFGGEKE